MQPSAPPTWWQMLWQLCLNELGDIYKKGGVTDPKSELTAFWAPFFLLQFEIIKALFLLKFPGCCSENGLESLEDDFLGDDWFKSIETIKVLFGDEFVLYASVCFQNIFYALEWVEKPFLHSTLFSIAINRANL
ncbi:hypothetical protein Pint_30242 [Pistacia integerrima]|uniref:Uncharacterized protein n=1 Tax=Pistacia integerrima TaxID=434235 RepID=A0ACC0WY20_9ROSI|nr:hypothetical protein Pint_30242 [Pistacia integerrima]